MYPRPFDPARELRRRKTGRRILGVAIVAFGIFMLLSMLDILPPVIQTLHFGWPVILVIIGAIITARSRFRSPAGIILILIGAAKLITPFHVANGVYSNQVVWPVAIIIGGLFLILRKRRQQWARTPGLQGRREYEHEKMSMIANDNDALDIDVTFGGRKEIVTSKAFRGGRINSTFGGVEVNLMQAEISAPPAVLEVKSLFSGVEIIVPSHWEVQNEIQPVMGGVEDQRHVRTSADSGTKRTLVLRGSCTFGSVEIKSY